MKKYQLALTARLKEQLNVWLWDEQSDPHTTVTSGELHRFLHTVRGTSGTIGLNRISEEAASLMDALEDDQRAEWLRWELERFLSGLILLAEEKLLVDESSVTLTAANAPASLNGKLLLVDDDEDFLAYLTEELGRRGYTVIATANSETALHIVHTDKPDAMVLDLHMQRSSGIDIMLAIREQVAAAAIPMPVIIMSADTLPSVPIQALRLGADDFIAKPLHTAELAARLERQLGRKLVAEKLRLSDTLTGVWSRSQLPALCRTVDSAAEQAGDDRILLIFQLAGLEHINRTRGEEAGNAALIGLANCLNEVLPTDGMGEAVIRYSGSRFAVLLHGAEATTRLYTSKVGQSLPGFWPVREDGGTITVVHAVTDVAAKTAEEELCRLLERSRSAKKVVSRYLAEQPDSGCIIEF